MAGLSIRADREGSMARRFFSRHWFKREIVILLALLVAAGVPALVGEAAGLAPPASAGPQGSPINTRVVMVSSTSTIRYNGFLFTASVNCPSGMTALGGGAKIIDTQ